MNQQTAESPIQIWQAKTEDADHVSRLAEALYRELGLDSHENIDIDTLSALTRDLLNKGKIVVYLAAEDEEVIGLITLHACAALYAGGEFGEVSELYVATNRRSEGIGQALLEAAKAHAKHANWRRLELGAPAGSRWDNTFSFYQNFGFSPIGPRLRLQL